MFSLRAAFWAALLCMSGIARADEQTVRLTTADGHLDLSGRIIEFDGEFYRLSTVYGPLTLSADSTLCEGAACPDPSAFTVEMMVSGARETGTVLVPALLEAFARSNGLSAKSIVQDDEHFTYVLSDPESDNDVLRMPFRVSTTSEGFADLLAEQAGLAMAAREIAPAERQRLVEAGLGDLTAPARSRVLALDGVTPFVAPENPLRAITIEDLARVLEGEITDWAALGGPPGPIALHVPARGLAARRFALSRITSGAPTFAPSAVSHPDPRDIADAVSRDPLAFGLGVHSESGAARKLDILGACGLRAPMSAFSLKAEDHPLTAPHFLYFPARRLPRPVREFLEFLDTPEAQQAAREVGFVDQEIRALPIQAQGDRLAAAISVAGDDVPLEDVRQMVSVLRDAERLSVTFRFEDGSTELDAQSRANLRLLSRYLGEAHAATSELLFVGFSDGVGRADANQRLSLRRAEAVRDAVLSLLPSDVALPKIETLGFGEALPMACDEDEWGRRTNRRVEIWTVPSQ